MKSLPNQPLDPISSPEAFGIPAGMMVRLDGAATYRHQPYLDLMPKSRVSADVEILPNAVIEANGSAALYLATDTSLLSDPARRAKLRDTLACRGDAHYLGIAALGTLHIFPVGFHKQSPDALRIIQLQAGCELHDFLVGLDRPDQTTDETWLEDYLFRLLRFTAEELKDTGMLYDNQVLSLVGRGLFTRFLIDRKIIRKSDVAHISGQPNSSLANLLETPQAAAKTFAWLDATFNGNLLPLLEQDIHSAEAYSAFFSRIGEQATVICRSLGNILHGALNKQMHLDWMRIRFDHVPADMLSQVYEHFAHAYWGLFARKTSIHYTPRRIAQFLVDAAFAGLVDKDPEFKLERAELLDPAAGAGVFLVLGFKKLVQEHWRSTGKRPTRQIIRSILERQLCGLDTNAEALKFAALSLYLTALELDPSPTPLSDLIFKELDKTGTLINVGSAKLGSLDYPLGRQFHIVIGNPPWTKMGGGSSGVIRLIRSIARGKDCPPALVNALRVKHNVPDIPFLWRSLEWAKPGGMIALALHAQHVLFQQDAGAAMREALLGSIEVTGILNGSALRQEPKFWPNNDAPFCLLLARNNPPTAHSAFYYLSPVRDRVLNGEGQMRLDPHTATPVSQRLAQHSRYIFKTLFRGTPLDHEIISRMTEHPSVKSLGAYWLDHGLNSGMGFRATNKVENDATYLHGKKMFEAKDVADYEIDLESARTFKHPYIHRRCDPNIFSGPLLLLRSPKSNRKARGALLAFGDLAYSETFIGYSTAGHGEAKALARYLQLLTFSDIFLYGLLMTSSKFGAEREAILKEEIEAFPFIPLEALNGEQCKHLEILSRHLVADDQPWDDIDQFFFDLYGLTVADRQVIRDTLSISLPFDDTLRFAESPPESKAVKVFAEEVMRIVQPFAQRIGLSLKVEIEEVAGINKKNWCFVRIDLLPNKASRPLPVDLFAKILADDVWASQIRCHAPDGNSLVVGQIAQNRYWTKTRARLLALDLLDAGLGRLAGDKGAMH